MIRFAGRKAGLLRAAVSIVVALVVTGGLSFDSASGLPPATVSASPTTVLAGRSMDVSWTNIPSPTVRDWIGLYTSGAAQNANFIAWQYTDTYPQHDGAEPFLVPAGAAAGNNYQLRLFANDGFTLVAFSSPITVLAGPQVGLVSGTSTIGNFSHHVAWDGIAAPTPTDWIGVYTSSTAADSAFVRWRYTNSTTGSGQEPIFIPKDASFGSHLQYRLFSNNGFTRLASSPLYTYCLNPCL